MRMLTKKVKKDNSLYNSLAHSHSMSSQRVFSRRISKYRMRTGMTASDMLVTMGYQSTNQGKLGFVTF
jgi:hypothetical protein